MNIAEILKNCPKGTKLYSPICGEVEFECVTTLGNIKCIENSLCKRLFYPNGTYSENGEVMLFPSKEQRDWNQFLFPFKNGDIIILKEAQGGDFKQNIAIFKGYSEDISSINRMEIYCQVDAVGNFIPWEMTVMHSGWRLVTDCEKQKFFTIIDKAGYKWINGNLVKLVTPKFKVGDTITNDKYTIKISVVTDVSYIGISGQYSREILIEEGNKWKLKKFDLRSLKPYDKVLVKTEESVWYPSIVSYVSVGQVYLIDSESSADYVIPFEGNEYLIGRCDDPDKYYITWE